MYITAGLQRVVVIGAVLVAVVGVNTTALAQSALPSNCPNWIDSKTGERVRAVPIGITAEELYLLQRGVHTHQAHGAGAHDYALIPCPPPDQPASVQTLPVLPFVGFGLSLGRRDHGDDPYRK